MLNEIKKGKYDGILAWNPDRLARNMLEGGRIIDMLDNDVIKDLKFVTHTYTPDANGKMLLGMAFVLSKQYSDKLSQDVTRGVRSSHQSGKSPAPKYGYKRNEETGIYEPDQPHFDIIQETWNMGLKGIAFNEIADCANDSGYFRLTKAGRKIKMSKQKISNMFRDPFYYGILVQVDQQVDLRTIYKTTKVSDAKADDIANKVHSLQGSLAQVKAEIKSTSLSPAKLVDNPRALSENSANVTELESEETRLKARINKLKKELAKRDQNQLTLEEFLNLSKNARVIVENADPNIKDVITRQIFLNFYLDEEKVASYTLKEPFKTLVEMRAVLKSRGDRT